MATGQTMLATHDIDIFFVDSTIEKPAGIINITGDKFECNV